MVKCVDAAFPTERGLFFSNVPLDVVENCEAWKQELIAKGAVKIVFGITIEEEGVTHYLEASDVWIKVIVK